MHQDVSAVAARVKRIRAERGWNQTAMAEAVGVNQSQVSNWEKGTAHPSPSAAIAIADLVSDSEKDWWYALSGVRSIVAQKRVSEQRLIPYLVDASDLGSPKSESGENVREMVSVPRSWLPAGGSLYAVTVQGRMLAPIIDVGDIAIVDVTRRKADALVGTIIASAEPRVGTFAWLQHDGRYFLLVPERWTEANQVYVLRKTESIIGQVVRWIGGASISRKDI